jgi:SAM-dependent methyltransferase
MMNETPTGGALQGEAEEIASHARTIRDNAFLYDIYRDFYARILEELPMADYPRILELGSGGGFLREFAPRLITSDCVSAPGIDRIVDACRLRDALAPNELDGICALNVFHHLPRPADFLRSASEVIRPRGRIVMIEPWYTPLGQWFHRVLHHEPYAVDPDYWGVIGSGRLAAANTRLPTSVFRDSEKRFQRECGSLRIIKLQPFHKWLYLLSGGLRVNTRVPGFVGRALLRADRRTKFADRIAAIFALVVLERRPA